MSERPIGVITEELSAVKAAFDAAGGRGVELAERVDELRDEFERVSARLAGTAVVFPDDERLVSYTVSFASGRIFQAWAEDSRHAEEQAEDAEPSEIIEEITLDYA